MLGLAGVYAVTSAKILLLVIAVTHLEMLEQLLPFVRFDGYFILSDLVGVPDLFARIAPVVRSSLLRRHGDPRVATLRRPARIVITAWVLTVVPLLTFILGYLILFLPSVNRALWHSATQAAHLAAMALTGHQYAASAADAVGALLAVVSIAGSLYVAAGLLRRAVYFGVRWSAAGQRAASWRSSPGSPARGRSRSSGWFRESSVTGDRRPPAARDSRRPSIARGTRQRPLSPAAAPAAAGLVPLPRGAPDKRGPERLEGRGTRGLFPALRGSEVRSARGDTRPQFPARRGGACRRPASTKERPDCAVAGVRNARCISYNCDGTAALTPLSGSRLPRSAGLSVILLPCGGGVRMAGAPFPS